MYNIQQKIKVFNDVHQNQVGQIATIILAVLALSVIIMAVKGLLNGNR